MASAPGVVKLRLSSAVFESGSNRGLLSSGVEIDCDLREIEHPEGRFARPMEHAMTFALWR